jgi:hypothetical protein
MYEVVKRCGSFSEPVPEAPAFEDETRAVEWARNFIEANPDRFGPGWGIEVRRNLKVLNEKMRLVDA